LDLNHQDLFKKKNTMNIIVILLIGGLVGWVASMLTGKDGQMGIVANIVIGILGSILGGFIYTLLFRGDADITTAFLNFNVGSLAISILGSVLLILILKRTRRGNVL
jgi:uncharacterized membrane protein YeaQ/YmgE (transglycosylase-associated protein family)